MDWSVNTRLTGLTLKALASAAIATVQGAFLFPRAVLSRNGRVVRSLEG
jgi:hypothetical protein